MTVQAAEEVTMLTVEKAAEQLGYHPETVRQKIKAKEFPAYKQGKRWYIFEQDLENWVKSANNANVQNGMTQMENTPCQNLSSSHNAAQRGTTRSPRQTVSEYANLLGLTTKNKPVN